MRSMIHLMDTIAAIPSLDPYTKARTEHLAFAFRYPGGIYLWLLDRQ